MLTYPNIDPVAVRLGPVAIHWYGLTYLAAFALFLWLGHKRVQHAAYRHLPVERAWKFSDVENLLFAGVIGVVLGGRLGYCLFYKPAYYAAHPLEIFQVWMGGMSFHGGLLGVLVAMAWYAYRHQRAWLEVTDFIAPCIPLGLACGRIGNFINGELWGRVTDASLPWGMVFAHSGTMLPRHPSQIYQFLLEGVLLFVLLWGYARAPRQRGQVSGMFLIGYGVLRFVAEFFREPDAFLGTLGLGLSMGQWLCVPMMLAGVWLWWSSSVRGRTSA